MLLDDIDGTEAMRHIRFSVNGTGYALDVSEANGRAFDEALEVPRVLFLGICLDFHYCLWQVLLPEFGFHLGWGSVSQALVEPYLVPP